MTLQSQVEYYKPMSGSEIARLLGITRQTVSATTKRALTKMYHYILDKKFAENPFDAMLALMSMCNVADGNLEDVTGFLSLFPSDIQEAVRKHSPKKLKVA